MQIIQPAKRIKINKIIALTKYKINQAEMFIKIEKDYIELKVIIKERSKNDKKKI